jgi:hypothetical protein
MSIKIVDEKPDVYLTQAERDRLMHLYSKAYTHYAGPPVSFEEFVRQTLERERARA